ncbi:U32 family peptidase C-terminal domain-containing protein [Cohaesibacter gelatinilyticus]|uniref:Putative protease n=1 Tax=Cohaesibacter gelatinilyticus TaxID=372072 RepID=A0A285NDW0_9HYPH|nr:U32 family peptidase C-terminal domain-containing protein [Cohaesibacter gelatinilyticus]SNZ07488.1 putative protease [Cohaesibacter gelatinilyticus]
MTKPIHHSGRPAHSELLMPAGNLEKLKMAVLYGADAIYMGTPDMSLRTKSQMTLEDVVEGIEFAHAHGKRVYLTLNLFSHNKDIDKLPQYVETVRKVKPDGLIVADPGVFMFVKQQAPELELHVSTQANVCSWQSVKFWESQGAGLCVLGREVSYAELAEIREKCQDIKLEAFVHGSMCMTYSGRCLLSNFMAERGANQGSCANSCRWKYKVHMKLRDGTVRELNLTEENLELFDFFLEEEQRPGELMQITEDERGSYILNSRDLCIMPKLEDYLKIGVDSLKVEGRGKSPYYVALVARAYRMAIDDWYKDPENWDADAYMEELATVPNRGYTLAFHEGRLTNYAHGYEETGTYAEWEYAGQVSAVEEDAFIVDIKNKLEAGDVIELVSPHLREAIPIRLYEFEDAKNGKILEVVNPGTKPQIRLPFNLFDHEDPELLRKHVPVMTVLRKERALTPSQWQRLQHDDEAHKLELGKGSERLYDRKKDKLQTAIDQSSTKRSVKSPRLGVEGCCGRGCNGCTIFWYDDKYQKARDLLAQNKQGKLLTKQQARQEIIQAAE